MTRVVRDVEALPRSKRRAMLRQLGLGGLSDRERMFIAEYVSDFNEYRAALAVGYNHGRMGWRLLNSKKYRVVAVEAQKRIQELEKDCELRGDYVRAYVRAILEFCPTDYFVCGPDGDWIVDPDQFAQLPQEVRRLVERVELRYYGARKYLSVEFVSKTAALGHAVRMTHAQKIEAAVAQIPWDDIADVTEEDEVEVAIAGTIDVQGSVQAEAPAMA